MQMHIEMLILLPKMPAPTILLTILALSALIDANRIPFHRGVVGGVVFPDAINATSAKTLEYVFAVGGASTPIPGQLRVVENSGICGTCILFTVPSDCVVKFCRYYPWRLSGLWIWRLESK
jgi:hypothetical protein